MQERTCIKWLLIAIITVMMTACGGGGDGPSAADQAVATFRAYAENPTTAEVPDMDDYDVLDVDLHGHTIDEINAYIAQLGDPDAVDSKAELDAIAAALGVTILDTDGDGTYNAFDEDDDGDGVLDTEEEAADSDPLDPNSIAYRGLAYNIITSPYGDHREWLDRNLGALEVCTKSRDDASFANDAAYVADQKDCFGAYFQWGRKYNGHEAYSSATDTVALAQDVESGGQFIAGLDDWRIRQDDVLWHGIDAVNNVCPTGFRVPTMEELLAETIDNSSGDAFANRDDAFNNFLKLPSKGYRETDGSMDDEGNSGSLWVSSVDTKNAEYIYFNMAVADKSYGSRTYGDTVRCIKDIEMDDMVIPTATVNASGIVDRNITITFSEPMDRSTLTTENIILMRVGDSTHLDYTFSETGVVVIIDPVEDLRYGTHYSINIKDDIKDLAGNPITWTVDVFETTDMVNHHGTSYKVVTSSYTNKQWLDRNLGATEVCTKSRDDASFANEAAYVSDQKDCFGDYYQWGRGTDGHEKQDSQETVDLAADVNNVGDKFITTNDSDWTSDVDTNGSIRKANWSKTDGTSVCPVGFRVPSEAEVNYELFEAGSAVIENRNDAFISFLKLPSNGYRSQTGNMEDYGDQGCMWTHTANDLKSSTSCFAGSDAAMFSNLVRAFGFSVRCIRAE